MNKKVLIGLGVLAVAGVAFYMWKKKQGESSTETKPEEKANALGRFGRVSPRVSPRVAPVVVANRVVASSAEECQCYDKDGNPTFKNSNCCANSVML